MSSKDVFHCEENDDEVIYYDGLKEAFIGLGFQQFNGPYAIYDREKAIEIIARDFYKEKKKEYEFEKMGAEEKLKVVQDIGDEAYMEAVEYFEYNTEGAWMGDRTPIFVIMKDLLTPIEPIEED
jgi:hypothetical protein|tara:strand:- start:187 stop:558 length:372 start_codon:yes stop_codon:yes gene_type:complete